MDGGFDRECNSDLDGGLKDGGLKDGGFERERDCLGRWKLFRFRERECLGRWLGCVLVLCAKMKKKIPPFF